MSKFKKGEVVRLKSGGPKMTITEVNGDKINCLCIDKDCREHPKTLDASSLEYGRAQKDRIANNL